MAKNTAWKMLDWTVRKIDHRTLDRLRCVVPLPIKLSLSRFLMKNALNGETVVVARSGHKFVPIAEPVFLQVRYGGDYERNLSQVTRQLIKAGDTVVDIGANFGWYTILMADRIGSTGKLFSFEPNGVIFDVLKQNVALNGYEDRVELFNCGVGVQAARGMLVADENESCFGYFKIDSGGPDENGTELVQIQPLDELMRDHIDRIAFIKIDVEGFEPFVLRGAKSVLSTQNPPVIQMEFCIETLERADIILDRFIAELKVLGSVFIVASDGSLKELTSIPKANANLYIFPPRGRYARRLEEVRVAN